MVELTQSGWLPESVRAVFGTNNQLKARSVIVVPYGTVPNHDAELYQGSAVSELAVKTTRDNLIMADLTHGITGQRLDLSLVARAGRVTSLGIFDSEPASASVTTFNTVDTDKPASTNGATIYAAVGESAAGSALLRFPAATRELLQQPRIHGVRYRPDRRDRRRHESRGDVRPGSPVADAEFLHAVAGGLHRCPVLRAHPSH